MPNAARATGALARAVLGSATRFSAGPRHTEQEGAAGETRADAESGGKQSEHRQER